MQEYAKAAWELTKTPEFQVALGARVAKANQGITHAEFVVGVQSRKMGISCIVGSPSQFIRGTYRTVFNILAMSYMVAPATFIPIWAWHEQNWWLLIGIVVSFIGTIIAAQLAEGAYSLAAILLIFLGISWFRCGVHNYYTFFPLCALCGLIFFMMADEAEKEFALQSLVKNPDVFEDAIARDAIMMVCKDEKK